jgi:hypothetical protein
MKVNVHDPSVVCAAFNSTYILPEISVSSAKSGKVVIAKTAAKQDNPNRFISAPVQRNI